MEHDPQDPFNQLGDIDFAWSWDVAYASARSASRKAGVRVRVTAARDHWSPTGWRWTWRAA